MIGVRKILIVALFLSCWQAGHAAWEKQSANTLAWLRDAYFFDENHGFVAGGGGAFLETANGGKNWTKRQNFTSDAILQIAFLDDQTGWLLCERDPFSRGANASSYLMKTADGGETWRKIEFKDAARARVTRIFFDRQGKGFAAGESGALFEETSAGVWEKQASPIRYLLLDGEFFDDGRGAIVGAGGSVFLTEDGGGNWTAASVAGKPAAKFNAVHFVDARNGWIVGAEGVIYQTINGGKAWREQNSRITTDLTDVFFKNTAEGWAVGDGGVVLHTTTAGNVWNREETGVRHRLERIVFAGKKAFAVGFGGTILAREEDNINQTGARPVLQKRNE